MCVLQFVLLCVVQCALYNLSSLEGGIKRENKLIIYTNKATDCMSL